MGGFLNSFIPLSQSLGTGLARMGAQGAQQQEVLKQREGYTEGLRSLAAKDPRFQPFLDAVLRGAPASTMFETGAKVYGQDISAEGRLNNWLLQQQYKQAQPPRADDATLKWMRDRKNLTPAQYFALDPATRDGLTAEMDAQAQTQAGGLAGARKTGTEAADPLGEALKARRLTMMGRKTVPVLSHDADGNPVTNFVSTSYDAAGTPHVGEVLGSMPGWIPGGTPEAAMGGASPAVGGSPGTGATPALAPKTPFSIPRPLTTRGSDNVKVVNESLRNLDELEAALDAVGKDKWNAASSTLGGYVGRLGRVGGAKLGMSGDPAIDDLLGKISATNTSVTAGIAGINNTRAFQAIDKKSGIHMPHPTSDYDYLKSNIRVLRNLFNTSRAELIGGGAARPGAAAAPDATKKWPYPGKPGYTYDAAGKVYDSSGKAIN